MVNFNSSNSTAILRPYIEACGYRGSRLASNYRFDEHTIPLAGFYGKPWDTRSACLAIADLEGDSHSTALKFVRFGAPTALIAHSNGFDWWKLTPSDAVGMRSIGFTEMDGFFREHAHDLSPDAIYTAKLRQPTPGARQLWFVDVGLMPAVERNVGETLHRLVTGAISDLATLLNKQIKSQKHYAELYKTVFWLLAAKLLNEKGVNHFKRLQLTDVDEVFKRVGKHYADVEDLPPGGKAWRPAINEVAGSIARWGYMGNISSEAVAYLYEKALIDKKPIGKNRNLVANIPDIRKELGIHSTPPVLVDHMLSLMWPMISEIPVDSRHVFEPACGHAGFLVAAMRYLRDFSGMSEGIDRHRYLRDHLHGIEIDPFAHELARLSLTLADVPYGNSWRIDKKDMLGPSVLADAAAAATVLLSNPPYESFTDKDKRRYQTLGEPVTAITKAVEMLKRTLPHLPLKAVFGVVVPQGFLHDKESKAIREQLLAGFELSEIAVFADNLFEEADHETAVLIGRRVERPTTINALMYRRVREKGMDAFHDKLSFSSERMVSQERFTATDDTNLLLPDLLEVWDNLADHGKLFNMADIQQGFQFLNKNQLVGREVVSKDKRAGWVKAVLKAPGNYRIWELPDIVWIDPDRRNIRTAGPLNSLRIPQVIVNYSPVAREPWRLKAVIDREGIAASSCFVVIRPKLGVDLRFLWAVLNSPVANAYAYCYSDKRHTLVKEWRAFPCAIPSALQHDEIVSAAERYITIAKHTDEIMADNEFEIKRALLSLDAAVLRFYDLPPKLERQLLDLFNNVERKGVGCEFRGYYPSGLDAYVPLHELISDEYERSLLGNFRAKHRPENSESIIDALRIASDDFAEE